MREMYVGQQVQVSGSTRFTDEGPWRIDAVGHGGRIRCSKWALDSSGKRIDQFFDSQEFETMEEFNTRRNQELKA